MFANTIYNNYGTRINIITYLTLFGLLPKFWSVHCAKQKLMCAKSELTVYINYPTGRACLLDAWRTAGEMSGLHMAMSN